MQKLALTIPTSEQYAKLAVEQAEQAKRFREKLTKDCNSLLQDIKEKLLNNESFDNVISNKDSKVLEDFRQVLMNMEYYLK